MDAKHMPHVSKEDFQKKYFFFSIFPKRGLMRKKMKILKKYFQNRKELQKLDTKHVPLAPKEDYFKKSKF